MIAGGSITLLAETATAGGAIAVNRSLLPQGYGGVPPHYHERTTEMFFLLDGRMQALAGEQLLTLEPGDLLVAPAGVVHALAPADGAHADFLAIATPVTDRFDYYRLMRMSEGVESAVHSCLVLAWLADAEPVPTARLAATFELPPAYLNKQLQAMSTAGIVTSTPGPRGGFRLARPPQDISLLDVVTAIEGPDEAFRCQEIRQRGVGASVPKKEFREQCAVAAAMRKADVGWRRAFAEQSLAEVRESADRAAPQAAELMREWHATR